MDIHTLALFMSLTNILQVLALYGQFRLNPTRSGLGRWTVGTGFWAAGFICNYLRGPSLLGLFAIAANNLFFIGGLVFIYAGVLRFFGRPVRRAPLLTFWAIFSLVACYFTFGQDDLVGRRVNLSIAVAILSFLIARALLVRNRSSVTATAQTLAIAFGANGVFFVLRAFSPLFAGPVGDIFSASTTQVASYLDALIVSTIWTYGFILMVNQRLNAENIEGKDNLERIFNTSPDAALITRQEDGLIYSVNDGFSELTGFTRAEVLGKTIFDLRFWHDPSERSWMVDALSQSGTLKNYEAVFARKDGQPFTGVLSAKSIALQHVPHIISVIHDISERKHAEQALRESEHKHRLLFNDSPDAYLVIVDGLFVDCNRASERLLRGSREQIVGKHPDELSPEFQPDGRKSSLSAIERIQTALETGSNTFEWVHRCFDATDIFVEVTIAAMLLDGKTALLTAWRDITARKQAELALQESQRHFRELAERNTDVIWSLGVEIAARERVQTALAESEQRYRLLAENTRDVIWVLDPDTLRVRYSSPSMKQLLGYSPLEAEDFAFADTLTPACREPFLQTARERAGQFRAQPATNMAYRDELVHLRQDGSPVWAETAFHYYSNPTSGQVEIHGVSRDISERKRLEAELQQQAVTDVLTGLHNRRYFLQAAQTELLRTVRHSHPLSVILLDLDHFKVVNDSYGHAAGDRVLVFFACICQETIRTSDVVARLGGDEFALLLPETTLERACQVAERLRRLLASRTLEWGGISVSITFTAGVACSDMGAETVDELLIRADQALYRAKESGRNRIEASR